MDNPIFSTIKASESSEALFFVDFTERLITSIISKIKSRYNFNTQDQRVLFYCKKWNTL